MPDLSTSQQQAIYESFDGFLKTSIKEYYVRRGKTHPVDFAALLMASGQTFSLGIDTLKEGSVAKKIVAGAVGAVALRVGLKYALSGPLGIIATGLTAASMASYAVKNQEKIGKTRRRFKALIAEARQEYEALSGDRGRFTTRERNLMVDGLMARFLQKLLSPPPEEGGVTAPEEEEVPER